MRKSILAGVLVLVGGGAAAAHECCTERQPEVCDPKLLVAALEGTARYGLGVVTLRRDTWSWTGTTWGAHPCEGENRTSEKCEDYQVAELREKTDEEFKQEKAKLAYTFKVRRMMALCSK